VPIRMYMDIEFRCPDNMRPHCQKIFDGEYDVPITPLTPVILDCGANCGAFSVWAAYRFPFSTIYAYEPHPKTFNNLLKNINGLRVFPHNHGIGNEGLRPLYEGKNNTGEATLYAGNKMSSDLGCHVEVIDPLTMPRADILKIDTEGCELEILEPLIADGRKFKAIMVEYHRRDDRRIIDNLLSDYVLTGASIVKYANIGTLKYVHKDLAPII